MSEIKDARAPRGEKIQKVLAREGLGSRREIEGWLAAGRIQVNGRLAKLGDRVMRKDHMTVDSRPVERASSAEQTAEIIVYHKPPGQLVTRSDPKGRPTVFTNLPPLTTGRWIAIGRLDYQTAGLLLLTTDGTLANQLMHPSGHMAREYAVRVFGEVTEPMLAQLVRGQQFEDGFARFEEVVDSGGTGINHWYHVVIMSGQNRIVRRLWESVGLKVSRLKRVRFGPIFLPKRLAPGGHAVLTEGEKKQLLSELAARTVSKQE
jgi:23S rRNA pseudouridine2605 synthase